MARYEFVIKNETSDESPVKAVTGENKGVGGETSEGASAGEKMAVSMAKKLISVGVVVHTVDQVVSHQHSLISLQTGAQEYGQRANFIYQKGSGLLKSVIGGAVTGSAGGPVGAAIGAVVGLVTNIGSNVMSYALKQQTINTQKDLEDISRRMRMMRATTSGRRYSNVTEF